MKIIRKLFPLMLCICLMLVLNMSAYAYGGENSPNNPKSFEEQIIEILLDCEESERQIVISKALDGDVAIGVLAPYLTAEELVYAVNYNQVIYSAVSPRKIPMLNVPSIMQEDKTWCGAATAQIVLTYLNGTSPTQSTIVNSISNSPSIDAVTAYINNRISTSSLKYTYKSLNVSGDFKSEFLQRMTSALQNGKPMILQIANCNENTGWPYQTNGHYCLCDGATLTYSICDPYYYSKYVVIPNGAEEGHFTIEWEVIEKSIKDWAAKGANVGYTSY